MLQLIAEPITLKGGVGKTYGDPFIVYGSVEDLVGNELIYARKLNPVIQTKMIVRYNELINTHCRIERERKGIIIRYEVTSVVDANPEEPYTQMSLYCHRVQH